MVEEIQLKLDKNGRGAFVIERNEERLAEMEIGLDAGNLTVYHTEVSDTLKGQGIGLKLLAAMVEYARLHQLKVITLCPFVNNQFKKSSDRYSDIWNQDWHS